MVNASKAVRAGTSIAFEDQSAATVIAEEGEGFVVLELPAPAAELAARFGEIPLPPYLGRPPVPEDRARYQTVFARGEERSVAAPTAGLHFTPELLDVLASRGIERAEITLHVGPGTFLPVRVEDIEKHRMLPERFEVSAEAAAKIEAARARGGRVIAVGTTATRVLESIGVPARAAAGATDLFIKPGHSFRAIDALITNFHLPRSTLIMLVSAFAGRERILAAYREAMALNYRFFSYGDAMLIL
jgi:S-adenosylmethionine:tRNA ribosyltransferase-isomerase